jgi:hypothetical protein
VTITEIAVKKRAARPRRKAEAETEVAAAEGD